MSAKKNEKIKFAIFIAIIMAAIVFIVLNFETIRKLDIDTIVDFVRKRGTFAILIYLLIFAIKPFAIIIPSNIIVICGGIVFGPLKGLILALTGFFISATVAFYVSRFLGKDFVQGIIGNKFINLDKKIENSGFRIILLLRLIPVLPFDPLSYACGFTNMKFFTYVTASVLGIIPETLCYCLMGKNAYNPLSVQFLLPLLLIVLVALLSNKFFNLKNIK